MIYSSVRTGEAISESSSGGGARHRRPSPVVSLRGAPIRINGRLIADASIARARNSLNFTSFLSLSFFNKRPRGGHEHAKASGIWILSKWYVLLMIVDRPQVWKARKDGKEEEEEEAMSP